MTFGKCLALVFSLMILGQAYVVRRYAGTWLFPACIFGLLWFGFTFVPLVVLFAVPIDPWGTGFILLCLSAFSFTAFLFPWSEAYKKNVLKREATPPVYESPFLKKTFYVLSSATVACILADTFAQGISLHDILFDLIATSALYRNFVSFDYLNPNIYDRLSEIMVYDVAILGGMLISSTPTKLGRFRIIVFSFIPGVLLAVAHSTKWALFSCIAFFYAGLLAYRILQSDFCLFKKGVLKKVVLCSAILAPLTVASFMSRGLQDSEDTDLIRDRLIANFASYSCGHLYAFSDWYTSYMAEHWGTRYRSQISYSREHAMYGFYTFAPLFRFAGSTKVPEASEDYYEYGDILATNIYTMFRGLIQDFGLLGSLLFMFLMGFLIHWSFFAMLTKSNPMFTVTVFLFSIGFFYASFGRSLFSWSGIYFSFALMWTILAINKLVKQTAGRGLATATGVTAQP
jgi:oligosaccharide repeat unit polymerase